MFEAPSEIMRLTLGGRSFTYAAPFMWNNLPDDFRNTELLNTFKRKLKTYLFRTAF